MNDLELERALRETFAAKAGEITSGPAYADPPSDPVRRWVHWIAPLAAAAAVLGVVGGVIAVRGRGPHAPAVTHAAIPTPPLPSRAATGTQAPKSAVSSPAAKSCPLPPAWKNAYAAPASTFGATSATALSVAADGTVVVYLDFGPQPGRPRQVALLRPGSTTPQVVYDVSDPDKYAVSMAAVYKHWLVVAEDDAPRSPKGEVPGSSPLPNVHLLVVKDLDSGTTTRLASTTPGKGSTIDEAAVFNGTVSWVSRSRFSAHMGSWHLYDLDTAKSAGSLDGSYAYLPTINPLGVFNSDISVEPGPTGDLAELDRVIPKDTTVRGTLTTDGTNYAWQQSPAEIGWWAPGHAARYVHLASSDVAEDPGLVVAGPLVFDLGGSASHVVDTRTSAVAALPASDKFGTPVAEAAGGSVIALQSYTKGGGHWVDGYWLDPQPQVLRIDASSLPKISC